MRIHILSDLHLEQSVFSPLVKDADLTILAGDIHTKGRGIAWAHENFSGMVAYILGNHEYYKGNFPITRDKMLAAQTDRVKVLDRGVLVVGNVRVLGTTGWTDFCATGNEPLASFDAATTMADYKHIRKGPDYYRLHTADVQKEAALNKAWLQEQLDIPFDGKTIVVTHHAPCELSLQSGHRNHLDAAYFNRWDDLMGDGRIALWVHGHTHRAADYEVGDTRVICNPAGYKSEPTGFDPELVV